MPLSVCALAISLAGLVARAAPEPALQPAALKSLQEQKQLRDFLIETYWGQLNAIKSVEYRYEYQPADLMGPGKPWKAHYARDGRRFRHDDGRTGRNVLWDGQRAYLRVGDNLEPGGNDPTRATPAMPVLESKLNLSLERVYGIEGKTDLSLRHAYGLGTFVAGQTPYTFLGSAEARFDGRDCIEVRYCTRDERYFVTVRHARDVGYWPINIHYASATGLSASTFTAFRYHKKVEPDGSVVFFPVYFEVHQRFPRGDAKSIFRIEEDTLRINEKIDEGRFKMEPAEQQKRRAPATQLKQ